MTSTNPWATSPIEPVPDAAAEELLAPAAPEHTAPLDPTRRAPSSAPAAASDSGDAFEAALRSGAIPTFEDLPADIVTSIASHPRDAAVEREAWQALLAFIAAHKDGGTTISSAAPKDFADGL